MSLTTIIIVALILSAIFQFIGYKAGATKTVALVIVLLWAGTINIAMSEAKPKAYKDIEKMKGHYKDTDALIEDAMPTISIYEAITITNSFKKNRLN